MTATLQEQVALITGAGQGVGQGIAFSLAKRGAKIVAVGRTLSKCEDTVASIKERFGTDAIAVEADIGQIDALAEIVNQTVTAFGRLDILVNNAVSAQISSLMDASIEKFEEGLRVGPIATLRLMQLAQPHMVKSGGGSIINTASISGTWAEPNLAIYGATKAAVISLTKSAALDLGRQGIRVNAVNPGYIYSEIWSAGAPDELSKSLVPMGRVGEADEAAAAYHFLASDEAPHITGVLMEISGGQEWEA